VIACVTDECNPRPWRQCRAADRRCWCRDVPGQTHQKRAGSGGCQRLQRL